MAVKNPMGKSMKPGSAYVVWIAANGWKYEILKLYKNVANSKKDPFARAFCYVHGIEAEYGDVYLRDISGSADFWAALEKAESDKAKEAA